MRRILIRPIIYGSLSTFLGKENTLEASHSWSIFVRGIEGEDLSNFIDRVEFHIHEDFHDRIRIINQPPYIITDFGWGEFTAKIIIHFKNISDKKIEPIILYHYLKLFNEDGSPLIKNRNIISEVYDELIFIDPTDEFVKSMDEVKILKNNPFKVLDKVPEFANLEQKLLQKIASEDKKLLDKIKIMKKKIESKGYSLD